MANDRPADAAVLDRAEPETASVALPWLFGFRWAVFAGQLLFLVGGRSWLGIEIPAWAIASPALLGVSNLGGWAVARRISAPAIAAGLFCLDTVLLTALLAATGGAANPFTILYLVQIALSALVLRPRWIWILAVASVVGFSSLFLSAPPSDPHAAHGMARDMAAHLRGMWAAFVVAAFSTALFVTLLRRSLDRRGRELASLRHLAARYDRLASLSAFAAGAAHELATPIGTIAMVAAEAARRPESGPFATEFATLRHEAERCRQILDDLAGRAGETAGEIAQTLSATALAGAALERLSSDERLRVRLEIERDFEVVVPLRALVRSLVTLLRNAFDASPPEQPIELRLTRDGGHWSCAVLDRGAGPQLELVGRIGEPFLTTKSDGLGLGLFATTRLADLLGGAFRLERRPDGGAVAELRLPERPRPGGSRGDDR